MEPAAPFISCDKWQCRLEAQGVPFFVPAGQDGWEHTGVGWRQRQLLRKCRLSLPEGRGQLSWGLQMVSY